MIRSGVSVILAGAVLLAMASLAEASSHGGMPASLSFLQIVQWELVHFAIHLQLTLEAICMIWLVSPSYGWDLLVDQSRCAELGNLTSHLFDTVIHALMTSFDSILVAAWVAVEAVCFIWRHIRNRSYRSSFRLA